MENLSNLTLQSQETTECDFHLHPLLINHIVDKILKFLDCTTLKIARQVNHLWRDEGAKHLIQTSYLQSDRDDPSSSCPPNSKDDQTAILALTQLISTSPTTNFNVHIKDRLIPDPSTLLSIMTDQRLFWLCSYGSRIHQLQYTGRNSDLLYKIFLLDKLQNLKILITNTLNVAPAGFQCLNLSPRDETQFFGKLSKVKEIRLNFCLTSSAIIEFAAFQNFQIETAAAAGREEKNSSKILNVTEIKFGWQFETVKESLETYMSFSLPWRITRLKLHFYSNLPLGTVREFFQLLSPTLKHLTIYLKIVSPPTEIVSEEEFLKLQKDVDDWLIPWSILNQVTTMEIAADQSCPNELIRLKIILAGLRLSKLKKLVLGQDIDEYLIKFGQFDCQVKSGSLKELEINLKGLDSPTSFFRGNLFPNLTRLLINFHRDYFKNEAFLCQDEELLSGFSFKIIYKELVNLERFEVTYEDPKLDVWTERWDEVVTGLKRPEDYQSGVLERLGEEELKGSIRNLKCLKRFMLHDWEGSTINRVSDFVIYNGLSHLKGLQSLHIYGHDFSIEAREYLKEELGPNVSILIFSNYY